MSPYTVPLVSTLPPPYPVTVPEGAGRLGGGPFLEPGALVRWRFRRFDYDRHRTEVVQPMRVVRDDASGAVLWLPGGTRLQNSRIRGYEDVNPHDVPFDVRFRPAETALPRVNVPGTWTGPGVLRIVPTGLPFSVWVFRGEDGGFRGWYVNLEHAHVRAFDADGIADHYTSDHTLDLWITPDGAISFKDEDEVAGSLAGGMWTEEIARVVRREADLAIEAWHTGHWAFDREWTQWAPTGEFAEPITLI
ncbi:DUF402 domain-containing protein [Brevibacterium samyangense]|uniref:DUF402 domain-containing protein n=1 Tax=Brevibacterium samyangense TaxID=366888 RepID=A0ABP5ERS8_9MICO